MGPESLIRRLGTFACRHGWDAGFALLLFGGLTLGANAVLAGATVFAGSLLPAMPAQASDQPGRTADGVARLPMFGFAEGRYAPAVLYPIAGHPMPAGLWLRQSEDMPKPATPRDPVIAICIDDLGEDLAGTDRAMALPKDVALSFLPYAESTPFLAEEARAKGHDVLAHVPMQALSNTNPGPMTLSVGDKDIAARAAWNLDRVPGLIGINNHEGSRFTADAASLAPVARLLAQRHLFFFDSRTGPDTRVGQVAASYGVATGERDVFLDDTIDEDAIRRQLDLLVMVARKQGAAIAIGHPHEATLNVLAEWLVQNHGVTLVRLPEAMQRKSQALLALR